MAQNPSDFDGLATPGPARPEDVIEDLGDGLVLRYAREEDGPANGDFQAVVQADPPDFEKLDHIGTWVGQLMDGSHPAARARDFLLVHDTKKNRIASSLSLLSHRLAYDGIEMPSGMPELVGTHPAYRHQKLVARQFEEIHRWSAERGDLLQLIDGIPWYYRQFGYEMTAQNGGGLMMQRSLLPKEGTDGLRTRKAVPDDAGFVAAAYAQGMKRYRLTCLRDEAFWRFEIEGRVFSTMSRNVSIIETEGGKPIGAFSHVPILLDHGHTWTPFLEIVEGESWAGPLGAALAFLRRLGAKYAERQKEEHAGAALILGADHPAHQVLDGVGGRARRPYAWYLRVPELPAFLMHVAPALDRRLLGTPYEGLDGPLAFNFYRNGVRLQFEKGHLKSVEPWRPATDDIGDARFPDLTFLHLLFGHRDMAELEHLRADVQIDDKRGLIETLFPKQPSFILPTT